MKTRVDKISVLLFLLTLIYTTMEAQLPKHVELSELGLSFDIPDGWSGGVQGEYILLGHETIPGMMLLFQNHSKTAQELQRLAMQGIIEEGVALSPSGEFAIVNNLRVQGYYEGQYDGANVKAFAVGLIKESGSGLSLLMVTALDKFTIIHEQEANKLIKTVRFSEPTVENNAQVQFWKDRLMGKMLKYTFNRSSNDYNGGYTAYNERKTVSFCANGRFNYYSSENASIDTGTNAGLFNNSKRGNEGSYEIYAAQNSVWLDLTFDTAEVYTFELTTDDSGLKTFIDGSRYLLSGDADCQ